jgi:phosphohistidine swiveling domain-containing protein
MEKKLLDLIFTRDFSLFTAQFWWRSLLDQEVKRVWGKGFSIQICNFNGRALEAYRVRDDVDALCAHIAHLPFDHHLFSDEFRETTRKAAVQLRELMKQHPAEFSEYAAVYERCLELWAIMYPGYMFSVFLPGPFAEAFKEAKGEAAEKYLKTQYDNRVYLEGLFEQIDAFVRDMAGSRLESLGIARRFAHLLTVSELKEMFAHAVAPKQEVLDMRASGYVLFGDELIVGKSFPVLLEKRGYQYSFLETEGVQSFKGTIAFKAPAVTGSVRLVFTHDDIKAFPNDAILVTAMTSPDFVPAMKTASAIVTDEGGVTCHAAIVARELKKPCVIGTKIATKALKDGDEVEVDAEKGAVKIIKKAQNA